MERDIVLHARGKWEPVKQDVSVNIHTASFVTLNSEEKKSFQVVNF